MTKQEFYNTYYPYALAMERDYNVPALVALAQSALETGYGKSTPGNMMFGIKANSSWNGDKQLLWTTEYVDGVFQKIQSWFRKYPTPQESFNDYAQFLKNNKRYSNAFNYSDPYLFAEEVAKAGYATDPSYYSKLKTIIDSFSKKKV